MAITNLGITPHEANSVNSKRITAADGTVSMGLCFNTQSDTPTAFNVYVTASAVNRVGDESIDSYTEIGSAGNWSDSGAIPASSFTVTGSDSNRYYWTLPFSSVTGLSSLLGALNYSTRSYDDLALRVEVRAFYDGGSTYAAQTCYIGFRPTLTATNAYVDKKGLWIEYSAANWGRPNDRFQLSTPITSSGREVAASGYWSTVSSFGKILIPSEKVLGNPANNETLSGTIRFAGSWAVAGTTLAVLELSELPVEDRLTLKTPTIEAVLEGDSVRVNVGQKSTGANIGTMLVQLQGSSYAMDKAEIVLDANHTGTHLFPAPPYGRETVWLATGFSDDEASNTVSAVCPALEARSGAAITPLNGETVRVPYNVASASQSRPDSERLKLAGRKRETVGFGEGGTVSWTISGKIVAEGFGGLYSANMETTDVEKLRNIPMQGASIVRLPEGERFLAEITNVNIGRPMAGDLRRTVAISAQEVS